MKPIIVLVTGLVLASCVAGLEAVPVAQGLSLRLPAPAELGRSVDAAQLVTARRGDEDFVFEVRLSVTPEAVMLVGTDAMGRRAMTIRWTGAEMAVERAAWLPQQVRPENVLADIVLLYWPEAAVRAALGSGRATVEDGLRGRSIRLDGREVIAASYGDGDRWAGTARLDNLDWGYRIEIRSSAVLPP